MDNSKENALRIKAIKPTVFFIKEKQGLLQLVDISVKNPGESLKASVEVKINSQRRHTDIGVAKRGEGRYRVCVPDVREITDVEFTLSASGRMQDRKRITWKPQKHWQVYLAHYSHHDLGYTDLPTNVLREYDGFYDEILRFCKETEDWPDESKFRYVVEQFWSLQHFIENRPKKTVDKLIKYIREGRIEVTALFGNQITELCGHEELIRLMYPSFSLKRKYDVKICSAALNDIPGLSWGLATILPGAGVKCFAAGIPGCYFGEDKKKVHPFWDEKKILPLNVPGALRWEGPDDAQMLFWYNIHGKGELYLWSYPEALSEVTNALNLLEKQSYPFNFVLYTVRGGSRDNAPPSLRPSHIVKEWNDKWIYPKLRLATYSDFFEQLEKYKNVLPVFRGELPNTDYTVGAISTARETGINRTTHEELLSAEKFATIAASITNYPYPKSSIREAYQDMLLYDEHTWGMADPIGPAQDAHWSEKSSFAYRAAGLSQDILSKSLNKIVDEIKLPDDGYHIVVFNSLSWERTDIVHTPLKVQSPCGSPMHLEYSENEASSKLIAGSAVGRNIINLPMDVVERPFELIDIDTGEKMPYQIVKLNSPQAPVPHASYRYALGEVDFAHLFEMVFLAKDVPSMGYKAYRLIPSREAVDFASNVEVRDASIENRFFKVALDPKIGAVMSIYDKEMEREIIDQDALHKLNQLIIRSAKTGKEEKSSISTVCKGKTGPIYGSLIVSGKAFGCPQIAQEIILYDKIKRIDIANRILKDSTPFLEIYFAFPFKIENPTFHFEGCNCVIEPLKDQFPGSNSDYYTMQHWASVSDGEMGVTLSSVEAPVIEFGGLWPGYVSEAHHAVTPPGFGHPFLKPGDLKRGYMYSYVMANNFRTNFQPVQVGERLFRYSITTHEGDWKEGKVYNFGWAFQNSLIPICMNGKKERSLSASHSLCQIDQPNVLLLALKQAEDGNGLIVRLMEVEGKDSEVMVRLPFLTIKRAYQVNLVEENEKVLPAQQHGVVVRVKTFGIMTIRLEVVDSRM